MLDNIEVFCQSSIKIVDDKIIYFDPYNITENFSDADIIFITHDHYDHFDLESINKVIKKDTILVAPLSMRDKVTSTFEHYELLFVEPKREYKIYDYKINTVRAYNLNKQFHPKDNNWVGYILSNKNISYYIMGDTDDTSEAREVSCDVLFIPIGGTYTMNKEEAANYTNYIKPKFVIPIHYGSIVGKYSDANDFEKMINKDIKTIIKIKQK